VRSPNTTRRTALVSTLSRRSPSLYTGLYTAKKEASLDNMGKRGCLGALVGRKAEV